MKQSVLAGFDWTILTNLALIIFLSLFIGILFWVFRKGSSKIYQKASNVPFASEGEKYELK